MKKGLIKQAHKYDQEGNLPSPLRLRRKQADNSMKKGLIKQEHKYDQEGYECVDIKGSIKQARKYDQEVMQVDGNPNAYRSNVCVLCDRLIIGCEAVRKITKEVLLKHSSRISVKSYEAHHQVKLKQELVSQYQIKGLEGLLLSPRAKQNETANESVAFDACTECFQSWSRSERRDLPPKHAISNGFAIGHIPTNVITNDKEVTEEMCSLLAPTRPFGYLFAYAAGAHKAIRGHFSFFEVDLNHTGAVMNHFLKTGANPLVYVVLCGRMTPKQKQIIKDRVTLDTSKMTRLLEWFVRESGHPAYEGVMPPGDCPQPTIIVDENTTNNTDQEQNPRVEESFAGTTFHFTSSHEPQEDTGIFESNQKFVKAMLDKTMPTLLVNGSNYATLKELQLENICPLQFPWGQGGPKVSRRRGISPEECYRHYCRLSLPQFFRGDFLLILNHMYNRLRSFKTAVLTCRSSLFGQSLAEKVSELKMKDLERAVYQKDTRQKVTGTAGQFLHAVDASCQPVGYSALNAKQNRRKHFAMDNYFGGHSLFLTTTPCDERTFRVKIFVNSGREVSLPNLRDWNDQDHMQECMLDLEVRKRTRSLYPGACSLVYQHLMDIVTKCLIGWDPNTQSGRPGVLGIPLALSNTCEEQGRKTLHCHWQIWIKDFNKCRDALFDQDDTKRRDARKALVSYMDKVICASYGTDFIVTHNCDNGNDSKQAGPVTMPMHKILQETEDKNTLRKAHHQDHCLDIKGKVLECKQCRKTFSPDQCIAMGVNHVREQQQTTDQGDNNHSMAEKDDEHLATDAIRKVWLDHAVIRYPYDFDEEGKPTKALQQQLLTTRGRTDEQISHKWLHDSRLRRDLLHYMFDEHDYTHRGTCFRGGKTECKGHLPEMAAEKTIIFDNNEIRAIKQTQENDRDHRGISDENGEKIILFHQLNGEVERKSQYTILPQRANGSQFLNQHNLPISDVLGCNTNNTGGDWSHSYYTTLYKSKDTQAEDKMAYHRVIASMGKRLWRAQQQQQQQQQENLQGAAKSPTNDDDDDNACFIEGLGRVITGVNALLSRDVVSSTMAHLLISQKGERFTYSHDFAHISLNNMKNVLEEKREVNFRLRRNWDTTKKETITWADCSAYDYIYRPTNLENICLYEYTMWFRKEYKSFKQMNNGSSKSNHYMFADGHQGQHYCHLRKLKHHVIPIIASTQGYLCDVKLLEVLDDNPTDSKTKNLRENYANTAMILFYPYRQATDLKNGTYWRKFVEVGGTKKYNEMHDESLDDSLSSQSQTSPEFWNRGRMILANIQSRFVAEKDMKRPNRKITYFTETPKSTGRRKMEGVDKEDDYDMDIQELFGNLGINDEGLQASEAMQPKPLADTDLRSHAVLINRANVHASNTIRTDVDSNASLLPKYDLESDTTQSKIQHKEKTTDTETMNNEKTALCTYPTRYEDLLTFIQGSTLVGSNETTRDIDVNGDQSNSTVPTRLKIPTLYGIARGKGSKYNLDEKQYIAYQIVCCTFLLQLVNEGEHHHTKLGEMLGTTLAPLAENVQRTKESIVQELRAMGAKDHLVMFLTGAAGCGKSTTMEAAQLYAHRFCTAIAAAFNDYTFYFTATTGSAAALFGGTTIHSAAHLNKQRLNDEMRSIWREDVRILIIDEISFFTASDVTRLDRQLKKLTGRHDMVYGGVSVVFSGDFHQLKPICKEDDVLYSESTPASFWENTINSAIFLDNSHRFKDDPLYGEILARMRMGEDTLADRELINSRVVGSSSSSSPQLQLKLPENAPDACFACSTNKERNGVTAASFKMHIEETHPKIHDSTLPPDHTLIIEATVAYSGGGSQHQKKRKRNRKQHNKKVPQAVHDTIITQLGDDDIKSSGFATKGAKIEPTLRIYPGSHHMCITNEHLDQGRGNGTLCKSLRVQLKENGKERRWKNWDGRKVWTVSIDSVEWVEFQHHPAPSGTGPRTFRLTPQEFDANIKFPLNGDTILTLGNAKITQIPVNSNIATTGHKLQGMSKDIIVVNSWNYRCPNWVYVVLSRVRTLAGLYLIAPLDLQRSFNVPDCLIRFEQRLKELKEKPILDMLGYHHHQNQH